MTTSNSQFYPTEKCTDPFIDYDELVKKIKSATHIIIGGAAGISASAGNDYTDKEAFKKNFPKMARLGFTHPYQFLGPVDFGEEGDRLKWAYRIMHAWKILQAPQHPTYTDLLTVLKKTGKEDNTWVLTSNVDTFFEKNGFNPKRIWAPQGDWRYIQCLTPCQNKVYDAQPYFDRLVPLIDDETFVLPSLDDVPKCPDCGGEMMFNVRGGDWYVETPHEDAGAAFQQFVESEEVQNGQLLILDIGSGFNTASVVRLRLERMALAHSNADFVRVNKFQPQLHAEHNGRGYAMPVAADEFSHKLYEALMMQK